MLPCKEHPNLKGQKCGLVYLGSHDNKFPTLFTFFDHCLHLAYWESRQDFSSIDRVKWHKERVFFTAKQNFISYQFVEYRCILMYTYYLYMEETFKKPGNRSKQSIPPAFICSLKGRYDNPIPTLFLAPIDCSKIPALE
jgi:hypothetical protein